MTTASRALGALALAPVALLVVSCQGKFAGLSKAACPQLSANVDALQADFSSDARANAKIRAFVQASKDIAAVSTQLDTMAQQACQRMGADLGLAPQQMAPQPGPGGGAKGACEPVARQIDAILRQGLQLRVVAAAPQCQANVQAEAHCQGACQVQLDPGQVIANCEPGKLSGQCQGRCVGGCEGRCVGQCNGQCSAVDARGQCVGQCNGQCYGQCDARCHARCEGQWQAPRCEGQMRAPSADAECHASCRAHANVRARCSAPMVQVQASHNTQIAARLVATLQANLPQLLYAQWALGQRLAGDVEVVVQVGKELPRLVGQAGANALACIAAASDATLQASASIKVSVQASASVSGRVGASGG